MLTVEELKKRFGDQLAEVWAHFLTKGSRSHRLSPVTDSVIWQPALQEPEDGVTFSEDNLGQWLPSREEHTPTGLECKGALRPAFEMAMESTQLMPDNNPATANCLCLFIKKSITLKDKQLLVL